MDNISLERTPLLSKISGPQDLQGLDEAELNNLAAEIRQVIISQVSTNGGHLASNLGVVELTMALLLEFDFPKDKLVFDVGHQCYSWKLLTGRKDRFASLRQKDGLSGFPKRSESDFDSFNTGHSSTSVSAAVGLARAAKLTGRQQASIAIIGDGALTGGMAYEALNDLGQHRDDVLVILNDNSMSIDPNVGGISRHLKRLRRSERYLKLKTRSLQRLEKIPVLSKPLIAALRGLKKRLRNWVQREGVIFDQMGIKYYGPIDGNDLHAVRETLRALRDVHRPRVLHLITRKGQGYRFAEDNPASYHGVPAFEVERGLDQAKTGLPTYSQLAGESLVDLARHNDKIVAITAAMKQGTGLSGFAAEFPDRFFDVAIAEQHAVTLAAGMAAAGLRPVVALYSTFAQRAMDQIIHDVCLQNLPVILLLDRAGMVSADGDTHQGYYDLSFLHSLPNLEMFSPITGQNIHDTISYALTCDHPVAIRYPRSSVAWADNQPMEVDFRGATRLQTGSKLSVLAVGPMAANAYAACRDNQDIDLWAITRIKPLPLDKLRESVRSTGRFLFLEDGALEGGIGQSFVAALLADQEGIKFKLLGAENLTSGQATRDELLAEAGLDQESIRREIAEMLQ